MWLFIPEGFYSIVAGDEFGHEIQVRTRAKADLERLREAHFPTLTEPIHLAGRDYPWRSFATKGDLATCLSEIALSLDYANFKNTVAHRHSEQRSHTYGRVWSACLDIEHEDDR